MGAKVRSFRSGRGKWRSGVVLLTPAVQPLVLPTLSRVSVPALGAGRTKVAMPMLTAEVAV